MPNQGTESQFEETTIDRLCALGYRYQYGGEIERDLRDVVITDWLRTFLHSRYAHLPVEAVEEVVARFTRPEGVTTEHRNLHFHQLLTRGHEQKYRKADGAEAFEHVHVVDWANATVNDFCVMNQLPIRGQNDRRPDVLIYVNGLPLVLFELKNPYEEEPNTRRRVRSITSSSASVSRSRKHCARRDRTATGRLAWCGTRRARGKSLSMAYFVAILRHHPQMENPTFVIQVDRTDSDDQLHDQFVAVKALVGEVQHGDLLSAG
jgi:type I site-specific restriction-modification system R (restriction) subunit